MASPQKENGYTAIANELFEAIGEFRIPGEIRQVFDVIMRKTYGYNKKEDKIANSQLAIATKMKRGNVSRSLSRLITNKLVIKTDNKSKKGHTLKINKDYSQWVPFVIKTDNKKKKKKVLSKRQPKLSKLITTVIKTDNKKLSELRDTKDNKTILKVDIQKKSNSEIAMARVVRDIIEAFSVINPACKKMYGIPAQRQACEDLVETYTFKRVMFVIEYTLPKTNNQAFFPTILTPVQLFNDWKRLEAAIMKYKSKVDIKNQQQGRGLA